MFRNLIPFSEFEKYWKVTGSHFWEIKGVQCCVHQNILDEVRCLDLSIVMMDSLDAALPVFSLASNCIL